MTMRQSALFALVLGSLGLFALSGCSAGNPNMSAAEGAMEQQNYDRALANVDSALTQDSANVDAYLMKARILRQMADSTTPPSEYKALYSRAREAEASALEFAPGQQSTVRTQRERAYIQEYQKGAKAFNTARRSQSRDAFLRAASYFGAAGVTQPDSTGPILNEAFSRLRAARLQEEDKVASEMSTVIPILERYIEKEDRPSKDAYTILSQLYLQNEQYSRALTLTKQAIDDLSSRPTVLRFSGTRGVQYSGTVETGEAAGIVFEISGTEGIRYRGNVGSAEKSRSVEGTVPDKVSVSASDIVSGTFNKDSEEGELVIRLVAGGSTLESESTTAEFGNVSITQRMSGVQTTSSSGSRRVEGTTPDRIELSTSEGTVSGTFYKTEGGTRQLQGQLRVELYKQGTRAASGQAVAISDTVSFSADLSALSPLADLQNSRLNALNQTGNTEQAMQAYKRQIERTPNDATYRYNYGSLLLNADRYDEAATQLSKAVELDPDDPKKQYNLGAAYLNKGVALQDSLVSLRDSLTAREQTPTAEEEELVTQLNEERRSLFEKSIPPLERARQLSGPGGRYSQSACTALFQAYVQTEQTEKAQEVKECAEQTSQANDGDN
jgi:tetratricopeptide (TPR) repeat protein